MRVRINNREGQSTAVEYVLVFFVVLAAISGMSVYVQRVLQAKGRDALRYMANTVDAEYTGKFYYQYEPYYTNYEGQRVVRSRDEVRDLQGTNRVGIAAFQYDDRTEQRIRTTQLPPVNGI